jgi:hypothetical protein
VCLRPIRRSVPTKRLRKSQSAGGQLPPQLGVFEHAAECGGQRGYIAVRNQNPGLAINNRITQSW